MSAAPPADTAPFRVLVVDDHPQNVLLAGTLLRAQGYTVGTATDGPAALAAVAADPPDLILLDVMMPGMDGLSVTRRLKAEPATRHIPVVLLTALQATADRVAGIEAGADDFISKPFDRHELLARVRSLIRVKRLAEAERGHLRRTLERHVDAAVAHLLLDDPAMQTPGGTRLEATVLFADIRGFSGWVEARPPEVVVDVLNRLLGSAVEAVFRHGGTVDKFLGDGLMALFGAPLAAPDHARRAVAAALDLRAAAATIDHPALTATLRVGCGVHTGEMVVGTIGSERRLDYTAVGHAVNLAKRLEESAAGGQVLVTRETLDRLGPADAADLGERHVKGQAALLRIFAVECLR